MVIIFPHIFLKGVYYVYCKIIKGEIPSNRVLESDKVFGISRHKSSSTSPHFNYSKRAYWSFHETPKELMGEDDTHLFRRWQKKLGLDGEWESVNYNIGMMGGQEIFPSGFHLSGGGKLGFPPFNWGFKTLLSLGAGI